MEADVRRLAWLDDHFDGEVFVARILEYHLMIAGRHRVLFRNRESLRRTKVFAVDEYTRRPWLTARLDVAILCSGSADRGHQAHGASHKANEERSLTHRVQTYQI